MKKMLLAITLAVLTCSSPLFAGYGAIAYSSSTGRWGNAYGAYYLEDASYSAVQSCGVADCAVVVWELNQCASLYVGYNGGFGWGLHTNFYTARSRAFNECAIRTAGCRQIAWVCN